MTSLELRSSLTHEPHMSLKSLARSRTSLKGGEEHQKSNTFLLYISTTTGRIHLKLRMWVSLSFIYKYISFYLSLRCDRS